tara:strand:- start:1507 stop:2214 length:708 start_codon:yes stop_codon:yes gene_type:complete
MIQKKQTEGQDFQRISNCLQTQKNGASNKPVQKKLKKNSKDLKIIGGQNLGQEQQNWTGTLLSKIGYATMPSGIQKTILNEAIKHAHKGKPLSPPHWIEEWGLSSNERVPVSKETIVFLQDELTYLTEPADPREGASVMEKTLELYGVPDNWERIVEFYLEVIEDLPLDIIIDLFRTTRMTLKWFPKPSELRNNVSSAYWQRKNALIRLRIMKRKIENDEAWENGSHPLLNQPSL